MAKSAFDTIFAKNLGKLGLNINMIINGIMEQKEFFHHTITTFKIYRQ